MDYKVVGRFQDVSMLRKLEPDLTLAEIEQVIAGRAYARWYCKNKKVINMLALAVPGLVLTACGIEPVTLSFLLKQSAAITAFSPADAVAAAGSGYSFWAGNGAILLHMLIVGFVTLVITTFLKFTGRGDIAPLVVFVGGGIVLYEVIGLFKSIYDAVAGFFSL